MPEDAPMGMCPKCLFKGGKTEPDSVPGKVADAHAIDECFGDFHLIEEIARGGMGVVYRARQKSLGREVALKMILSGQFASEREVERFVAEAEAAAHLRHPNIVAVHEFGNHEGHYFYTMDFIHGCHLDERLSQTALPIRDSVSLLIKVARAVHFAHERGVIHRDLKPQNIMLDEMDEPKVTDFGLAKRMDLNRDLTLTGTIFGSPAYMAPEQAQGRHEDLGPQTDVYALGAVMYRMLTGKVHINASSPLDALKQVVDSEPESLLSLNPKISPDLETICLKCLEKQPGNRYHSAEALADELERWIENKPIFARKITSRERFQKWIRRNPILSSMSLLVLVIGMVGFAGIWWQLQKTRSALLKAEQLFVAEATARAVEMKPYLKLPHQGPVVTATFDADGQRILTASHDGLARLWNAISGQLMQEYHGHNGVVGDAQFSPDETQILTYSFDTQFRYPHMSPDNQKLITTRIPRFGDRTVRLWDTGSGHEISRFLHPDQVVDASFSPDGKRLITASWDHKARIWDIHSTKEIHTIDYHKAALLSACYSPTGNHVAISSSGYDYNLTISPGGGGGTTSSIQENMVASIWNEEDATLHSVVPNRSKQHFLFGGKRSSRSRASFSPDGKYVVIAGADTANLLIWDVEKDRLKTVLKGHESEVLGAGFSPDGSKLVSYSADTAARVWDVESGKQLAYLSGHQDTVLWAEFSPDGKWIATSSGDQTARVWDAASGIGISVMKGHSEKVYQVRFSPDGLRVVTASEDGTVCLWDAASLSQMSQVLEGHHSHVVSISFSPDGRHVATGSKDHTAMLWEIHQKEPKRVLKGYSEIKDEDIQDHALGDVLDVRFSPDGKYLVTSSDDSRAVLRRVDQSRQSIGPDQILAPFTPVRLWNFEKGNPLQELDGMETGALSSRISPDSKKLLGIPNGDIRQAVRTKGLFSRGWSSSTRSWSDPISIPVWDIKTGSILYSITDLSSDFQDAAFSPDGRFIATLDAGKVKCWDAGDGSFVREFIQVNSAQTIEFSPDSKFLLVRNGSGLGLWDVESGKQSQVFASPNVPFLHAKLSDRGEHVIAWNPLGTVWVFEVSSGERILFLQTKNGQLRKALLNPDATMIVTIGWEDVAWIWDVETGRQLKICEGHTDSILDASISPDGNWLGTVSEDYTARLWPLKGIRTPVAQK